MAPRRAAALAGALVLALAVCQTPVPATAQTASSWMQVFNMLLKPRTCANGKVLAVCRRDPCAVTDCPTGFKCKADYCGACAGVCEVDGSAPEEDKLAAGNAPTCELTGQPGKKAVRPQCSTPMCTYMQCGKGSACVNDFCGGCTGTCVNATETMGEFCVLALVRLCFFICVRVPSRKDWWPTLPICFGRKEERRRGRCRCFLN